MGLHRVIFPYSLLRTMYSLEDGVKGGLVLCGSLRLDSLELFGHGDVRHAQQEQVSGKGYHY